MGDFLLKLGPYRDSQKEIKPEDTTNESYNTALKKAVNVGRGHFVQ